MAPLKERIRGRLDHLRQRLPWLDHAVRMVRHYGQAKASQQAGAITYFGFLSFFPILALAFFVVGYVARVYPDAQADLVTAIDEVLPGMIGDDAGQISMTDLANAAGTVAALGVLGTLGVLYAGLGWLSAVRNALLVVFELPAKEQPGFVAGKLRDLVTLVLVGVVLMLSVAISGFVSSYSGELLDAVGLGDGVSPVFQLLTVLLGLAASALLFFVLFRLLAAPPTPTRSLWWGAVLGAVGFELLKRLSSLLLASTKEQPAFQAFGIALILLVWINLTSRVVLYAAAWAHTSAAAREIREREAFERARLQELTRVDLHEAARSESTPIAGRGARAKAFAAGGATALGLAAVLRRRRDTGQKT